MKHTLGSTYRRFNHLYMMFALRGDKVLCPCCGWTGKSFAPLLNRSNAICPSCSSRERHRILWLFINRNPDLLPANSRVLHFAPEKVLRKQLEARSDIEYVTTDLNPDDVDVAADITNLPFEDGSFDFIICSHVLEHVDEARAMNELLRVLANGGLIAIQIPVFDIHTTLEDPNVTSPKERERVFGQRDHLRRYGHDAKFRLEALSPSVTEVSPNSHGFTDTDIRRFGIVSKDGVNRESIYLCRNVS